MRQAYHHNPPNAIVFKLLFGTIHTQFNSDPIVHNLSFPSVLDAQLFEAATTQDVARVLDLYAQGARMDVVFDLNYEISRDRTTHFSLTALEAVFIGWDLDKLAQVVAGIGPLPGVVLPNIRTALHSVSHVREDLTRSPIISKEHYFINNIRLMAAASDLWGNPFVATTYWECIAPKELHDKSAFEQVVKNLQGNIPATSDPKVLERIFQMAQRASFTCGCLLFTTFGVDPTVEDTVDHQKLKAKSTQHELEPRLSRVVIEQATEHNSASFARRKI